MSGKTGYARYTFAFASDVQKLADEKHIRVISFRTEEHTKKRGSYDVLSVLFAVPRPDKDIVATAETAVIPETPVTPETPVEPALETKIAELEKELTEENEVNTYEI